MSVHAVPNESICLVGRCNPQCAGGVEKVLEVLKVIDVLIETKSNTVFDMETSLNL